MSLKFSQFDKNTLGIALPLIISNITIPLVGLVDNIMMGHLGSTIFIGAIGLGSIIISYILFSFGFIKSITTGLVSQNAGSRDYQNLFLTICHILLISSFISLIILYFRFYIIDFSLGLMNSSIEVKQNSKIYLEYRIWSIPAIFLRDILIGYYIGTQRTKIAMSISIIVNLLNIILDYYFIYILNFSIEGVAIASLISEYSIIFFVLYALMFEKKYKNINLDYKNILSWKLIKNKIIINIDMFIRSFILMTCFAYFMSKGASYGNVILAANTILLNFFFIFSHGVDGFAHASEVLVGDSVGKKNKELLHKSISSTGKFSIYLAILFIIFFSLFDVPLLNVITDVGTILLSAQKHIMWLYLIFFSACIAFWLDGVFIGAMKTKLLRNVMILSGSVFFILEIFIFEQNNHNLWAAFLVFFTLRSMLLGYLLSFNLKRNRFI